MVGPELHLVAVFGQRRRLCHDACVAHEDVESGRSPEDCFCCFVDGGEGCQVAGDEREACGRVGSRYLFDEVVGALGVPSADVDVCGRMSVFR